MLKPKSKSIPYKVVDLSREPRVSRTSMASIKETAARVNLLPKFPYEDYRRAHDKLPYQCLNRNCQRILLYSLTKIQQGQGCTFCSSGLYERYCKVALEQIFSADFPTEMPEDLVSEKGYRLELDGYNSKLKIAFEHQGSHHYTAKTHYGTRKVDPKDVLIATQERDKRKIVWAERNEVLLIVIPELTTRLQIHDLQKFLCDAILGAGRPLPAGADKTEIDYSLAHQHNPGDDINKVLKNRSITGEFRPWLGTKYRYPLKCEVCDWGMEGQWTPVLVNVLYTDAGCPQCHRIKTKYLSTAELLDPLIQLAQRLGRTPMAKEAEADKNCAAINTYCRRFGSYNQALAAAGLAVIRSGPFSRESLIKLLEVEFSGFDIVRYTDIQHHPSLPYPSTFMKSFGSVSKAVRIAGFRYAKQKVFSKRELIAILRRFAIENEGRPPVQKELGVHIPVIDTFIQSFGSYNAAVRAARLRPNRVTNRSQESLISDLVKLGKRLGTIPTAAAIDSVEHMATSRTYHERFGSLTSALNFAGFNLDGQKRRTKKYSKDDVLDYLLLFYHQNDRYPTNAELNCNRKAPGHNTVNRLFGGIKKAVIEAERKRKASVE